MKQKGEHKEQSEKQIDVPSNRIEAPKNVGQLGVQAEEIVEDRVFTSDRWRWYELVLQDIVSAEQNSGVHFFASLGQFP